MLPTDRPAGPARTSALLAQAAQLVREDRAAEALPPLRQAASLEPLNAAIHNDLGVICLQAGLLAEAVAAFQAALAADPRFAPASLRLGLALQAQGHADAALAAYRHATRLRPALAEARFRAGALLESLGRTGDAIAAFRRASASAPKTALGRLSNARALLAEDRHGEAERALRQLLARQPDHAAANEMLGTVLADAGRFEEARDCYARAIGGAPLLAGSYYELVRCRRIAADDADLLARMRAAVAAPGLPAEARLRVHLALGKAADDLDDPEAAMRHFDAADALRAGLGSFDLAAFEARIDRLMARFTPDSFARLAGAGSSDATPVLIVGLPRSGTTLVEQILSCHPDIHPAGELPFWTERGALWERAGGEASFLANAASDYGSLLHRLAPNAARVVDKMPLNVLWAGLIHTAMPRATIIHCRRDPADTALSIHRTYLNPAIAFPTGGAALVGAIRAVERLAAHWRAVLPRDRFFEVGYERLAGDPEPEIARLVAACGLPWNACCLRPELNGRIVRTPSKWQVRQPISGGSVAAWRRYEPWLGPLRALLG